SLLPLGAPRFRHISCKEARGVESHFISDSPTGSRIMRNAKVWLFVAFLVIVLVGVMTLTSPAPTANAAAAPKDHWRYHDKHWSYWDDADRRWYYTDGSNWYSRGDDDDAWKVYTFDKGFGR